MRGGGGGRKEERQKLGSNKRGLEPNMRSRNNIDPALGINLEGRITNLWSEKEKAKRVNFTH